LQQPAPPLLASELLLHPTKRTSSDDRQTTSSSSWCVRVLLCARILAAAPRRRRWRACGSFLPVGAGRLTMLLLLVHVARFQIAGIGVGGVGVHLHSIFSSLMTLFHAIDTALQLQRFVKSTVAHVRPSRHNAASCCGCVCLALFDCQTALSVLVVAIQPIPLLESVHLLSLNMFTSLQDARAASTNEKQSFAARHCRCDAATRRVQQSACSINRILFL
jgi:hypothetical protein